MTFYRSRIATASSLCGDEIDGRDSVHFFKTETRQNSHFRIAYGKVTFSKKVLMIFLCWYKLKYGFVYRVKEYYIPSSEVT